MNYTIREATLCDAEAIWKLNSLEMGYQFPLEITAERLEALINDNSHKILVAVCGDDVVGYIHAVDYDLIFSHHMKNIMGIAVASSHKRKGIGKALLTKIELWGKETGAAGVRIVSGANRKEAHEFYRNCGYCGEKAQLNLTKFFDIFINAVNN